MILPLWRAVCFSCLCILPPCCPLRTPVLPTADPASCLHQISDPWYAAKQHTCTHSPGEPATLRASTALPCGCCITIPHPRQPRAPLPPLQSSSKSTSKTHSSGEGASSCPLSREGMEEFKQPRKDGQKPVRQQNVSSEHYLPQRTSPWDRMLRQHRGVCCFVRKRKEPFW